MRLFALYVLVLALIVATRIGLAVSGGLATELVLHNARGTFAPLTSPGLRLFMAAALMHLRKPTKIDHGALLRRAARPIAATGAFLVVSQVMREARMVEAIAHAVERLHGWVLWILVPAVGMLSGFATGSNVGGEVLFINLEHRVGASRGHGLLFTAAHSSSAGHAVFTPLPIIMLLLVVAAESDGENGTTMTPHELLRFALGVALVVLVGLSGGLALLDQLDLVGRLGHASCFAELDVRRWRTPPRSMPGNWRRRPGSAPSGTMTVSTMPDVGDRAALPSSSSKSTAGLPGLQRWHSWRRAQAG